jgi:hypothetical protein
MSMAPIWLRQRYPIRNLQTPDLQIPLCRLQVAGCRLPKAGCSATYQRDPTPLRDILDPLVTHDSACEPARSEGHDDDGQEGYGGVHRPDEGGAEKGEDEEGEEIAEAGGDWWGDVV